MTVRSCMTKESKDKGRRRKVLNYYYEEKSDQESVGSSSETESPRSVARIGRWKKAYVHSQVLRIREEDSHIGEDFGEGCPDLMIFSKPILPSSPLSGNRLHRGE